MKLIILGISLILFRAHAQEVICDPKDPAQQILKLASDLSIPNCVNEANLAAAKANDTSKLCNECKSLFESRNDSTLATLSIQDKQALFIEGALKQYKKVITNNLVDTLKLRSLRPTGSDFKSSREACKIKTAKDLPKSCSQTAIKYIEDKKLLSELDKEVSNELAKIISKEEKFSPKPLLLNRLNPPLCHIPEKDALYISSSAAEEMFSPEMMKALLSLDISKFRTTSSMFMNEKVSDLYEGDIEELFSFLANHPLMGDQFKTPQSLISFLKTIPEPKDVIQLRKSIYNKSKGDEFDSKLALTCKQSFDALVKNICSNEFESGDFGLSPFANQSKLLNNEIIPSDEKVASNDQLVKLNNEVLKLCEPSKEYKVNFTTLDNQINSSLSKRYQTLNLEGFKIQKFDADIGRMTNNICSSKDKECNEKTILCKMIDKYKSVNDPKSLDYKLANSSNEEVNKLLRSMIGDTSRIDSKTKEILIAQGIIPKDDGTMVKQPDIPERQPEFFAKEQSQQPGQQQANANTAKLNPAVNNSKAASGRSPANDSTIDEGYSNVGTKTSSQANLPDFSDLMEDQQELRSVQDEIKRRLLGSEKKLSEPEARKVVRDSFKSRKQPLSQDMEDAFTNRILDNATTPQAFANNTQTAPNNEPNRASVSGGESANAKWRKQQDQNALMDMAGAQKALGKDASNTAATPDAKPKDLTRVALNLAEDPRVNLSELFNKKIDQNDSETQLLKVLLKNKNNFLLQIKAMNFKVIFDEKNNFNVLLESGDKQEAARIRPQLEMFLKKLKS